MRHYAAAATGGGAADGVELVARVERLLGGLGEASPTAAQLAGLDQCHVGGLAATEALAALAAVPRGADVLDAGSGLGGPSPGRAGTLGYFPRLPPTTPPVTGPDSTPPAGTSAPRDRSPQWRDGRFRNRLPRRDGPLWRMLGEFYLGGSKDRTPSEPIPVEFRTAADYAAPPAGGLRVTWLGHATTLVEMEGVRLLVDPVWAERASPVGFAGPRRFHPPPLPLAELPAVDAVVLSHDHFDHLDDAFVRAFVRAFARRGVRWVAPLGVGDWLRRWGVAAGDVVELDWWEATRVGGLTLTATPARHFSGRGPGSVDRTLWCGWAVVGERRRVYYAGDTALQDEFAEVGARLGPFDLTIIEVGAYDALWPDVHLGPEQAVRAHQLVRGGMLLPVHWGTFDLAPHGWTEPVERTLVAAERAGVRVVTPRPGGMVEPGVREPAERWWPALPWRTAAEAPVRSTGVAPP